MDVAATVPVKKSGAELNKETRQLYSGSSLGSLASKSQAASRTTIDTMA